MPKVDWVAHKHWVGPAWTKFVLRKRQASEEVWVETLRWLNEQTSEPFMAHVCEYDQYIVVKFRSTDDAFAFKMRWL
jgi:hypothetical protein